MHQVIKIIEVEQLRCKDEGECSSWKQRSIHSVKDAEKSVPREKELHAKSLPRAA